MFCTNCGENLQENVTVCPNCGKEFPKAEQPVVEPVQQPTEEQPKKKNGCLIAGLIVGGSAVVLGILTLVIIVIVVVAGVLFTRQKIVTPSRDNVEIIEEYEEEDDDYEYEDEGEDDFSNSLQPYSNQDYILPDSNSRYITESDLRGLTKEECRIARNEIYARHGRMFKDAELQAYFNGKSWYTPSIPADAFQEHMLNDYEKENKDVILEYERERGWN